MKNVLGIRTAPPPHWVGDGFHVNSLLSYDNDPGLSPFLLLDHAMNRDFAPTTQQRGVGWHPHRGFETVTIVYDGEVEHRDSLGNGGVVGEGDVQWMTAASGILHEEFHSRQFASRGGKMHMVQLWVNLPAKDKMSDPGYQALTKADIPVVSLADSAGSLRVIAGEYGGVTGAAHTHSAMDVFDMQLKAGIKTIIPAASGRTLTIVVLNGKARIGEGVASAGQLVLFSRDGADATIEALEDSSLLILGGEPLGEPVSGYGPFVMNTRDEIREAIADFNAGRFGPIPS